MYFLIFPGHTDTIHHSSKFHSSDYDPVEEKTHMHKMLLMRIQTLIMKLKMTMALYAVNQGLAKLFLDYAGTKAATEGRFFPNTNI